MRVAVVVLGDVGRSPRMCYHTLSLAQHGCDVDLVGYHLSERHQKLNDHSRIRNVNVCPPPDWFSVLHSLIGFALKFFWTSFFLFTALFFRTGLSPNYILVQNPPGIPCLFICWLVARLKRSKLIVDWHNYTCTVLRYTQQSQTVESDKKKKKTNTSTVVRFAEWWESYFGPRADYNLCVTHAMRDDLLKQWNVRAVTVYDRPPDWKFQSMNIEQKHQFFSRLAADKLYVPFWKEQTIDSEEEGTRFSFRDKAGLACIRNKRPAVLISSTSWTVDEDFGILLNAIQRYDSTAKSEGTAFRDEERLPNLVAVITGKGPMKANYMEQIKKLKLERVEILTPWLSAEDYPKLLSCADLGVCLHVSTSGLDLPMKVVDMFGCGLPVLAKRFACIDELVKEGENGHTFDSPTDLCESMMRLLRGFPSSQSLNELRSNLEEQPLVSWDDNWDATVWPLIECNG